MKQFNIAKFVLFAGASIGLVLLVLTGYRFNEINSGVTRYKQKIIAQNDDNSSVVIKSPQRANGHDDSQGIWKSQPFTESASADNAEQRSPFYVASGTTSKNISLSQTEKFWNRTSDFGEEQEEKWKGLPEQLTPRVQAVSPLRYSGKPSETEYQLDTIEKQLGTLADQSQLQYQRGIRKSAAYVRNLQREMRIDKLQHHLEQLKWSRASRNNGSHQLENQYTGQRYFFIARQNNSSTSQEPPSPEFLLPNQPAPETRTTRQQWSPRKTKLR